jgi:putative membrane protein
MSAMSERSFYQPEARAGVRAAIEAIEAQTCAEIVVTVRRASGDYRGADYLCASLVALAALVGLLFAEHEFSVLWMPVDVAVAWAIGALASAKIASCRRLFAGRARMASAVRTSALAAFVELGVSRTRARSGILVYVAMLERRVELVADVGVDVSALGAPYEKLVASLQRREGADAFLASLRALGPLLAPSLPRASDDINELSDEVHTA